MNSENEEKFKFALLQVDKRLLNLEMAVGEINEKIKSLKSVDTEIIDTIKERLDELEDLILVENLGEIELKRFLENIDSKTAELSQKTEALSQNMKRFEPLLSQIEQTKNLEGVKPFESSMIEKLEGEISEIKEKSAQFVLKDDIKNLEKNIQDINEKIVGILSSNKQAPDLNKFLILEDKIKELDELRKNTTQIENCLKNVDEQIVQLKKNMESIEPFLKKMEEVVFDFKTKANELEDRTRYFEEIRKNLISLEEEFSEMKEKIGLIESSTAKHVNEKIATLPLLSEQILGLVEEVSKIKEDFSDFNMKLEQITSLDNEIKRLDERIKPLETQLIKRVASEISDLRAETSKEIKEIKDKISGIIATKSEIDIKFLSSRLNSLKENVDYLLNRKAEIDMKIESLQKILERLAHHLEEISTNISTSPLEKRVKLLEEKIEKMPNEIFTNLKNVFSRLPEKVPEKLESVKHGKENDDVEELLEKISSLENKLMSFRESSKSEKTSTV